MSSNVHVPPTITLSCYIAILKSVVILAKIADHLLGVRYIILVGPLVVLEAGQSTSQGDEIFFD